MTLVGKADFSEPLLNYLFLRSAMFEAFAWHIGGVTSRTVLYSITKGIRSLVCKVRVLRSFLEL